MPILFSAAEADAELIYAAILTDIVVEAGDPDAGIGPSTTHSFTGLHAISPSRPLSSLRKRDGKPLSDSFIRPYAIVETPSSF